MTQTSTRTDPVFKDTTNLNSLNLGITTRCSMKCPNCSIDVPYIAEEKEATHAKIADIARDAAFMRPLRRVHVTGGEPTLHPEFGMLSSLVREMFHAQYVTLETNGARLVKYLDVVKAFYDRVFITTYEEDAVYPGSPSNLDVIETAKRHLRSGQLILEPPVRHTQSHVQVLSLRQTKDEEVPCSKWYDPGLPAGWYNGLLYPCCVSFGIRAAGGIPVDANWRERIVNIPMGCQVCCYRGT